MNKMGIIAAMEEEMIALHSKLQNIEVTTLAGMSFYSGRIHETSIVLVQSGIGKVNAAVAVTLLINHFKAEAVINTGSAGAIQSGLDIGDTIISNRLAYCDADSRVFGYDFGQIPQMPLYYNTDVRLQNVFESAAKNTGWNVVKGDIVTSDSFISDKMTVQKIRDEFPDALVCEMEGTAVAQTCFLFDIPCLVVRAVSDNADQEAAHSFDEFILEAGKKSAKMVMYAIEILGSEN